MTDGNDGDDGDDGAAGMTKSPSATALSWGADSEYRPRYNVAPQSRCVVIRRGDSPNSPYQLQVMKWGLVPSWMKEPPAKPLNTINARDDKVDSGEGMWRNLRSSNRCVVVAQGFYEWQVKGKDKLPHFTKLRDDKLMIIAGMHDSASCVLSFISFHSRLTNEQRDSFDGGFDTLQSFTIITTSSNTQLRFLHTRMPVILTSLAAIKLWLSPTPYGPAIKSLMQPYTGQLDVYRVAPEVGSVKNDSPEFIKARSVALFRCGTRLTCCTCMQPLYEKKGNITSMFAKVNASQSPTKSSPPKLESSTLLTSTSSSAPVVPSADLGTNRFFSPPTAAAPSPFKKKRIESITLSDSDNEAEAPPKKKAKASPSPSSGKKAPLKKGTKAKQVEQDGDGNPCVTNYFKKG